VNLDGEGQEVGRGDQRIGSQGRLLHQRDRGDLQQQGVAPDAGVRGYPLDAVRGRLDHGRDLATGLERLQLEQVCRTGDGGCGLHRPGLGWDAGAGAQPESRCGWEDPAEGRSERDAGEHR
jgi:hypothetical protein